MERPGVRRHKTFEGIYWVVREGEERLATLSQDPGTPVFGDARFPEKYRSIVQGVDTVYADIAQSDQARILSENIEQYLSDNGEFLFAVKARSIDVSKDPSTIFRRERTLLEEKGYKVKEMIRLDPFERDHCMILGSKR